MVVLALWGAAEAIVLPVVPDVGLGLLVLAAPGSGWRLFAAVVAGAVVGSVALWLLAAQAPDTVRAMLLAIPGIDAATLEEARAALIDRGVLGFAQLGPGPPLKVYTTEWLDLGGDVAGNAVGAVVNRLTRIGPVVVAAAVIGSRAGPWIREHAAVAIAAYVAFWIVVYAIVLG
jgi:hypothetical protein